MILSELRQDILTGEWVIFAGNRTKRPYDFIKKSVPKTSDKKECQFCPGNEHLTTEPVYQDGDNGEWKIRVFPNKYPAVEKTADEEYPDGEGIYTNFYGKGIHEVIVDTPDHFEIIENFDIEHIYEVLKVLKKRYNSIFQNDYIKYVQIFKNCGPDAGASLMHSHWQIIGVPIVPGEQKNIVNSIEKYKNKTGKCLICSVINHETENKTRVVFQNEHFVAVAPYASKMSYECDIMSKEHITRFSDFNDKKLYALAEVLKCVLLSVKNIRKNICYNLCFEDTPKGYDGHWFMKVLPRMGNLAGFEYGTSSYINPVLPEDAASYMRKIISENYRG